MILKGVKVKTHVWCWWAVCWSCFAPTKDHDIVFAEPVEVYGFSGAGAWPAKSNCSCVRWWADVLWATQEDPCYLQVPDRSCKLHEILQQRLQLPPGTWQTSRILQQLKSVRVANCSFSLLGHMSFSSCTRGVCRFTDNLLQVRPMPIDFEKFMNSYSIEITYRATEGLIYMELHTTDKHLQVVTINMLTYHKQRKFIFSM